MIINTFPAYHTITTFDLKLSPIKIIGSQSVIISRDTLYRNYNSNAFQRYW